MSADVLALRASVRELLQEWRAGSRFQPVSDSWMRGFDLDLSKELAARGLIGLSWPVDVGGRGLSNTARLVVTEELLRAGAPVAAHWIGDRQIGPAIIRHGSSALQEEILPGIIAADHVFCLGLSESNAGSDLASVSTTAVKVAGGWRVSGRKMWTSHAHLATHLYLLARTDSSASKHGGLSEFIVDMKSEGISVSPIVDLAGEHHFNEVTLDGVFVPDSRLLGTEGEGWQQVVEQLSFERGGPERYLSSYPLFAALLHAAHTSSIDLRRELGELTARLASLRHLAWKVALELDAGRAPVQEAVTLKYLGNEFEGDVVELAREVLGASGGVAPEFRQALLATPGFTIRGGAADVLLGLIAREESRA